MLRRVNTTSDVQQFVKEVFLFKGFARRTKSTDEIVNGKLLDVKQVIRAMGDITWDLIAGAVYVETTHHKKTHRLGKNKLTAALYYHNFMPNSFKRSVA